MIKPNSINKEKKADKNYISFMDTTLRDGEQTHGVSFSIDEKIIIAQKLLQEVKVDRIEVTSAKVSLQEKQMLKNLMKWANENGYADFIEVLSFVDYSKSIDWLKETGCKNINLLTKGSKLHCECQLNKGIKEHLDDIEKTLEYANKLGIKYSIYLEDWSKGMLDSLDYVFQMVEHLEKLNPKRILLPDTLGILSTDQTFSFVSQMVQAFPKIEFEFHGHNDYGIAVANAFYAVKAGAKGLHTTINSLGERAGNTNLIEIATILHDHSDFKTNINEEAFHNISEIVERFSGKRISMNTPIVGRDVFTQTAGIHADGDKKGNLYESILAPKRFKRDRIYALGKLAGKSSLDMNLDRLGITLDEENKKSLLEKIIKYGEEKKIVTLDDLPYMIADIFEQAKDKIFTVDKCIITSSLSLSPVANIQISYKGKIYTSTSNGNGGYDAFMNALKKIKDKINLTIPQLIDFEVRIPPGGNTDALVETTITWKYEDKVIKTQALLPDQVLSSIKATERVINLIEDKKLNINNSI